MAVKRAISISVLIVLFIFFVDYTVYLYTLYVIKSTINLKNDDFVCYVLDFTLYLQNG